MRWYEQDYQDTDLGHAEQLIQYHGKDLKYCPDLGGWFVWTGVRWEQDKSGEVHRRVQKMLKDNLLCAAATGNQQSAKRVLGAMTAPRINNILSLASNMAEVRVKAESFDAEPYLFNVMNGTVDLRTGNLRNHERNDLITKLTEVAFDPEARAPEWSKFLAKILPSEGLREFVQKAVGYSITGDVSEQCLFINHGSTGSNGKSTLMETVHAALGDYGMHTPVETLMVKRSGGVPNDVARLKGQRFVTASESEEGQRLAENRIKEMTGGDTISARYMRAEWFDFKPTHKLWLSTNHKPKIRGTENAIWRRIRLIPFDVTIPEHEQDKTLTEKLRNELEGILAWAIRGARLWFEEGLPKAEEVEQATAAYREEQDVIGEFITDECVEHQDARVKMKPLYEQYKRWANDRYGFVKEYKEFKTNIEGRGHEHRRSGKNGSYQLHGIGLQATEELNLTEA